MGEIRSHYFIRNENEINGLARNLLWISPMALKLSIAMMLLSAVVCVVLKSDKKERKNSNLLSVEP